MGGRERRIRFVPSDAQKGMTLPWRRSVEWRRVPHNAQVLLTRLAAAGVPVVPTGRGPGGGTWPGDWGPGGERDREPGRLAAAPPTAAGWTGEVAP